MKRSQILLIVGASLLWLSGCGTSTKFSDFFKDRNAAESTDGDVTGSVPSPDGQQTDAGLLGSDPKDDLSVAKLYYRQENFGLAEYYFRRAVESHPKDAEGWLGLAAAYDRLRRFDLADRAYGQAIALAGPLPEILNNQGYSYILRGDYRHAQEKLAAAKAAAPENPYILNNLKLLAEAQRKAKAVN
ncbi:MAG TPA: hypothetical protein VFA53_00685 [Xanthobacteraceae bacterium]|nr:hypothetical protein [Xanthobacteraceae bacterium]